MLFFARIDTHVPLEEDEAAGTDRSPEESPDSAEQGVRSSRPERRRHIGVDGKCHRNKPPPSGKPNGGKGEKAVQETTGAAEMPCVQANPARSKIK